jgi:hypothetical protein
VNTAEILGALDEAIREASPEARPGLVVQLAARVVAVAAGMGTPATLIALGPDENLGADEAARRLGVSVDWLYKSKLPFKVKIGRRVLFSARGLERWNRQRTGIDT